MSRPSNLKQMVVADPAALASAAAERLMARIDANAGRVAICLTGGSSPKELYRLLAGENLNRARSIGETILLVDRLAENLRER